MNFLIDAQLPIALARHLRAKGHVAHHVVDIGLGRADDTPIWDRAIEENDIIITKDEDFAIRRILATRGPTVVWLRIGNSSNRELLRWIDPLWDEIIARLTTGDQLVEVI